MAGIPDDFVARFWSKVDKTDNCWVWTGAKTGAGYGAIRTGGRTAPLIYAHRASYELAHGDVPIGLTLDHLCHNADESCRGGKSCAHRACVNPSHLEPTTHAENVRRGRVPRRAA